MQISKLAKNISPSSTLAITARAKQLKAQGRDVISLGAGEPDFDTPDYIKESAVEALNKGITGYTPASGSLVLKEAVKNKFHRENGLDYDLNQIIISCGAKHSLFNIIMCSAGEGDEIIIPAPYWVSYPEMVKASGATPVFVDCTSTDFKLTPQSLAAAITENSRLLILNSPSNPTGAVYNMDELRDLAKIAAENNLTVISDEIYEHLVYDKPFASIASVPGMKERTIVVNGVSKAFAMTGWRIGYAAGDPELISACSRLQSHSTSNPTSFSQEGAATALNSDKSAQAVSAMRSEFKKRRDYIFSALSGIERVRPVKPEGAFYIFCDISQLLGDRYKSSLEFSESLLESSLVAVVPGEGFGADGFIRISFATSMEELKEGVARIRSFAGKI